MFWRQMAYKMDQLNLYCRQQAVAIISGTSHDDRKFYDEIAQLSGLPIATYDKLLKEFVNKDKYCHFTDNVS